MDLDADDQAMAQALGFSSFGAQDRPQKKRKYNPHADAAGLTSGQRPKKEAATGSNLAPLGTSTRVPATQPGGLNNNEISLDDDEEEAADGGAALNAATNQGLAGGAAGKAQAQTQGQAQAHGHPHGLPQRPPPTTSQQHSGPNRGGHHHGRHHQGRPQGSSEQRSTWYEGYYDPSSNENPWKRLEDSLGLQSNGSWLSRDAHPVPTR